MNRNNPGMPLSQGTQAPDFKLPSTEGRDLSLEEDFAGQALVLYFYPKDFTPGCTQEACSFQNQFSFFQETAVPVLGISPDSVETHRRFKEANQLEFILLSDRGGRVARKYHAQMPLINVTRRITYLLDDQHKIRAVFENMFNGARHAREMQQEIRRMQTAHD
jgi:peroxiredoxin Q/BCP